MQLYFVGPIEPTFDNAAALTLLSFYDLTYGLVLHSSILSYGWIEFLKIIYDLNAIKV